MTRPRMHHFDLSVIGSGPGGQRAATQAAKLRKRVAICEKSYNAEPQSSEEIEPCRD